MAQLGGVGQHIVGSSVGIIDPDRFAEALQKAQRNEDVSIGSLKRTLTLESWLRHLTTPRSPDELDANRERQGYSSTPETKELQAPAQPKSSAS